MTHSTSKALKQEKYKCCIGSSSWSKPGWVNLDFKSSHYESSQRDNINFNHDLMSLSKLPFSDNSVSHFYCSHVLEHISDDAVAFMLKDCARCLIPGGIFRITCPDMEQIYQRLLNKDDYFFTRFAFRKKIKRELSIEQSFLHCFAFSKTTHAPGEKSNRINDTHLWDIVNKCSFEAAMNSITADVDVKLMNKLFPANHHNWWSIGKLRSFSDSSNEFNFHEQKYNCSKDPEFVNAKFFDKTHPFMSLYVDLEKK